MAEQSAERHPSITEKLDWFEYEHLNPRLSWAVESCAELAETAAHGIPDHPQLALGLQKLIEAKDCFVRALIAGGALDE